MQYLRKSNTCDLILTAYLAHSSIRLSKKKIKGKMTNK